MKIGPGGAHAERAGEIDLRAGKSLQPAENKDMVDVGQTVADGWLLGLSDGKRERALGGGGTVDAHLNRTAIVAANVERTGPLEFD